MRSQAFTLDVFGVLVRCRLFHTCPSFACGSIMGPGMLSRWWAERGLSGWVFLWDIDELAARFMLEERIGQLLADLVPSPAELVDQAQAERHEGPQL